MSGLPGIRPAVHIERRSEAVVLGEKCQKKLLPRQISLLHIWCRQMAVQAGGSRIFLAGVITSPSPARLPLFSMGEGLNHGNHGRHGKENGVKGRSGRFARRIRRRYPRSHEVRTILALIDSFRAFRPLRCRRRGPALG